MAKTYEQLQQQIEKLQRQAKALQAVEAKGVIDRIKVAIAHYGLTADQLGFDGQTTRVASTKPAATQPSEFNAQQATPPAKKRAGRGKGKPQFSDDAGNTWGGRGPRPAWLRQAISAGRDIGEFRIGKRANTNKAPAPLDVEAPAIATSTSTAQKPSAATRRAKVSYGDDAGHSWSGMGPKPGWLKAAIEAGKSLTDFAR